jgi:hypothetical protein
MTLYRGLLRQVATSDDKPRLRGDEDLPLAEVSVLGKLERMELGQQSDGEGGKEGAFGIRPR